jgi:hypothetical protein
MYFYDPQVVDFAARLQPSPRGELEITDLNRMYLERGQLRVEVLGRGVAWLDAGTHESLLQSANFVHAVQERQGLMISCPERSPSAWATSPAQLAALAATMAGNSYAYYLQRWPTRTVNILLFGKNSQLGWELRRTLAPRKIVALDYGMSTSSMPAHCQKIVDLHPLV